MFALGATSKMLDFFLRVL